MKNFLFCLILCLSSTLLFSQNSFKDYDKNWPTWRGPLSNGVSPNGNPPIIWSEHKNIKWKVEIPGEGYATPIIWGNQIFVETAISLDDQNQDEPEEQSNQGRRRRRSRNTSSIHKFTVLSINRNDGKILWQKSVKEEVPQEGTHQFGSWASNSPVTDGKNIYAYFGSRGLFCLDMKGNVKWERDFGQMEKRNSFGEGSSPALSNDKVIVLWDQEGESFIIAVDKNTGKDVWKVDRDEVSSWSTPFIVEINGTNQVITSASKQVRSYDADTGKLIWQTSGLTSNVISMPVLAKNWVYVMSGHRGSALLAIDLNKAKGDISNSDAIVWKYNKDTPYTPSPILLGNILYFLKSNNGILTGLDIRDGKIYYSKERLEGAGNLFTSPVGVQDRFYILGGSGTTYVIKSGPEFKIIAQNKLEDGFHASPVILGNNLYLRGFKNLYCISEN